MVTAFRVPRLVVVCVCVLSVQSTATLFAGELTVAPPPSGTQATKAVQPAPHLLFDPARLPALNSVPSNAMEGQYHRGRYGRRHDAALTAIVIGAAATITGAAVLTYANRPECSVNEFASGCGYGTKVIGTSVLAGGLVSMVAGAVTW